MTTNQTNSMKRSIGNANFPIWLLGDSAPEKWASILRHPLDPKHPIRHNIWTSVENEIQDNIFRACRRRLDLSESQLYIQNAVEHANQKPIGSAIEWPDSVMTEVTSLQEKITEHQPRIVITFGSFAFEFGRRVFGEKGRFCYKHWNSERLGVEFHVRTENAIKQQPTLIPLLHRSIAGGHFKKGHEYFCGRHGDNYFSFTASRLARAIIQIFSEADNIWIE